MLNLLKITFGHQSLGQIKCTIFSGCVGDDREGNILESRIKFEGVSPKLVKSPTQKPTGKAVSLITRVSVFYQVVQVYKGKVKNVR